MASICFLDIPRKNVSIALDACSRTEISEESEHVPETNCLVHAMYQRNAQVGFQSHNRRYLQFGSKHWIRSRRQIAGCSCMVVSDAQSLSGELISLTLLSGSSQSVCKQSRLRDHTNCAASSRSVLSGSPQSSLSAASSVKQCSSVTADFESNTCKTVSICWFPPA